MGELILSYIGKERVQLPDSLQPLQPYLSACFQADEVRRLFDGAGDLQRILNSYKPVESRGSK